MVEIEIDKIKIRKLVDKYNEIISSGKISDYNEEMTKKDFILPLFNALGWDTENSNEVSAEEAIKNKRVDYAFKIDGIPKFFLEAKSLREDDIINLKYVEQAIDYAWMKSCSWAVLTNFRTLIVYNAEQKTPDPRMSWFIKFTDPKEYLEEDNRLMLLSKESIETGKLDIEAEKYGKKELKKPVDKALLDDITNFRELLYNNIKRNNTDKELTDSDIEEAVQRIIDRMIFIRSAEDRGLEPEELRSKVREYSNADNRLLAKLSDLYKQYDDNYNSKLFAHYICDDLKIDDDVLSTIINGLYESKDGLYRYDFSLIHADILGNIYEQYLGRILKKVGKTGKLEISKAKRKSEGIYYTPTYIVDYIVKNTVEEYIKTHKEKDIENIKILDPACGSGSFLLKAYDTLENYWKEKRKLKETKLEDSGSYSKKVEIVTKNIFGVDLDEKAVEIAQLNLLLKIAEKRKRLPTLQQNIKNGNSLIDDQNIAGDKAFKWDEEFADIMKNGGFDIIIGNPPYGADLSISERNYITKHYTFSKNNKNTALVFIEKSLKLLNENGTFGMIVPKSLAYSQLWGPARKLIKDYLIKVIDVSKAFEGVLLEQVIIILNKGKKQKTYGIEDPQTKNKLQVDKKYIELTDSIILDSDSIDFKIFNKLNDNCIYLAKITKTSRGLPLQKYLTTIKTPYPVIRGKDISRYTALNDAYLPKSIIKLNQNKVKFLLQQKIVSQRIVAHVTKPKNHIIIMSALDTKGRITVDTVENTIVTDNNYSIEFLLCLLNSRLISWYSYRYIFSKAIRTMDLDEYYLDKIPIPKSKVDNKIFISLVRKMITAKEKIPHLKNTNEKIAIEGEVRKLDEEINNDIYKIYGITDEEKKIIEESLK